MKTNAYFRFKLILWAHQFSQHLNQPIRKGYLAMRGSRGRVSGVQDLRFFRFSFKSSVFMKGRGGLYQYSKLATIGPPAKRHFDISMAFCWWANDGVPPPPPHPLDQRNAKTGVRWLRMLFVPSQSFYCYCC